MFQLSYGNLITILLFSDRAYIVHKCNVMVNIKTSEDPEILHDGSWGAEPHTRTRRKYLYVRTRIQNEELDSCS